ncbi:MAG: D-alanyl-D-alanine carboxypeptidase [Clostridiales bacterium]|jgi:D-alanyl-D-alanine carboxypeptidase (penicillin-binding protein 5/6)|nr:D-alanyl-D-alanine carboxypeptidase [Clostridiales bacterium]
MRKKLILLLSFVILISMACPLLSVQAATFQNDVETSTKSLYLYNVDFETPVYEKNAQERRSPASTTKIMTYIITIENVKDPDDTLVTVTKDVVDQLLGTGSSMSGVLPDEQLTVTQLLHCLMIPSGNDAAMVLANYVGGGNIQTFVDKMNEKARELGCANTHFTNPHGLYNEEHYTTAEDLTKIARYAMDTPKFMEITSKMTYELPPSNVRPTPKILENTNSMMLSSSVYYYQYVKGIKTGWIDEAGKCLVSTASKDGYSYLCVALGGLDKDDEGEKYDGSMVDTRRLYRWAFENLERKSIVTLDKMVAEVPLELAWQKDRLQLLPKESVQALLPKDVELASITITPNDDVVESVTAPVKQGTILGTATLSYANQVLGTVDLVAAEDVNRSELLYILNGAKKIVTSKWFLFSAALLVVLFIVYLILSTIYTKRNKRRRKVKKYRKL